MVKIVEMDGSVTLRAQLEEDVGPVILLNKFTVKPEDTDEFLKVFSLTTEMFKQQPGFISAQLHHGIGGVIHSLIMSFGNLQSILNKHSIDQSFVQAWLTFYLTL